MRSTSEVVRLLASVCLMFVWAMQAQGVVYILVREVENDVVVQHAGTLDLTGLTFDKGTRNEALLHPQYGSLFTASGQSDRYFGEDGTVFQAFGPPRGEHPETFELADISGGESFGVGSEYVFLPGNYVSRDHFSGFSIYRYENLASLQLTPGTYVAKVPHDLIVMFVGDSLISGNPAPDALPETWPYSRPDPDPDSDPAPDPEPLPDIVSRPEGVVPNAAHPANELYTRISPILGTRQNQPTIVNGYLVQAGNARHAIWDISDPYHPQQLSEMLSPNRFGEAESHQVSFARYPSGNGYRLYFATTSGTGIDLWDVTDATAPEHLSKIVLTGVNYGDAREAVWGIHWQGDYIYVGGTNTGLHIVDASDPSNPILVKRVPNPEFGGISAGPLYAVGNVLVITTPKNTAGIATMDISDPANPLLLDFVKPSKVSYIGGYHGGKAFLLSPFRTYDVMTDPRNITLLGQSETPKSEYLSFDNDLLFLGSVSRSSGGVSGVLKHDASDPNNLVNLGHILGGGNERTDDQFSVAVGNLIVISDDGNRRGSWIGVHDTQPDTSPPVVLNVNPADGATNVARTARVGVSFSDQIELATVGYDTFIVRPLGGDPLSGKWGYQQTLVTFWPDRPLDANEEYEIVLPEGGIADVVGNSLRETHVSFFSTAKGGQDEEGEEASPALNEITPTQPAELNEVVAFAVETFDTNLYRYSWDFGDGTTGEGPLANHQYGEPGRYSVLLTVAESGGSSDKARLECEDGARSGGVRLASNHSGYSGTGYADYPFSYSREVNVSWTVPVSRGGRSDVEIGFANGSSHVRPLSLYVNGDLVCEVDTGPTGGWSEWDTVTIPDVGLSSGSNFIELVSEATRGGPNVDYIELKAGVSETKIVTRSVTQIIHRPLTEEAPTNSSSIIVDNARGRVWSVNPDADTVTAVSLTSFNKELEAPVGDNPRTLAQAPSGEIWVVNQDSHNITILDTFSGSELATINLDYGSRPFGIAFSPDGTFAYVTLETVGRLLKIDPASRNAVGRVDFGPDGEGIIPQVRGVALTHDSKQALVTRFISPDAGGELHVVNTENMSVEKTITLASSSRPDTPDSGRGIPNYLSSVVISPDGSKAWLPSKQDNIERGLYRDGQVLTHDSTVRPIISQVDMQTGTEVPDARADLNDADSPFATTVSEFGDLLFTAVQGLNAIDVRDAYSSESVATFTVGLAPQGLVLDDQGRLFVQNFMSRTITVLDVSTILDGSDYTAETLAVVDSVSNETLSPQILMGKQIFYDGTDERMSFEGYLSCATCHLDDGQDGRVWDLTDRGEGLRNTITLRGRSGTGHGNVHWTANFDEIQDFENDMRLAFSGVGFLTDEEFENTREPLGNPKAGLNDELDALAAYVASLTEVPSSPHRAQDGTLTAAGLRGEKVFNEVGCISCHSGPNFTDGLRHDVGTIQAGSGIGSGESLLGIGFDTPTLKGVWNTAPYLHNGAAKTLYEVLENDEHSNASDLSQTELDDLVAYLLQIDDSE